MKTTDPRDSLDRRIDQLLSSRPIQPSADLMDRVLSAVEATDRATRKQSHHRWFIRCGMGMAAALACAFVALQLISTDPATNLSALEAQEILLLEEGVSNLPDMVDSTGQYQLMATFDAIYFEIES